jgi:cell division protein FtsN
MHQQQDETLDEQERYEQQLQQHEAHSQQAHPQQAAATAATATLPLTPKPEPDQRLSGSSTFVYADQWNTVAF